MLSFLIARRWPDFRLYDGSDLKTYLLMSWWGLDALAVVGPAGVYLLDFFCSGVQFYFLLSPCLCFVSFLCPGLYVLGDDALVGWGSFVRAKHIRALIHIWAKGEVGAP